MSGGTPVVGGGRMRQRHSQGYTSSGDDLEDDACSRPVYFSSYVPESWTWFQILEIKLWIASVIFIIYYGDRHSNFIYLLLHDNRIRRTPLRIGMFCVSLNILYFFYRCMLVLKIQMISWKWEISSVIALPFITMLGLTSFFMLSFALWPIWSFLTIPLVVIMVRMRSSALNDQTSDALSDIEVDRPGPPSNVASDIQADQPGVVDSEHTVEVVEAPTDIQVDQPGVVVSEHTFVTYERNQRRRKSIQLDIGAIEVLL